MDSTGSTVRVPLSNGGYALVDACDYPLVAKSAWHRHDKHRSNGSVRSYARATIGGKKVSMHRHLTQAAFGEPVDHWDNDGLNNRRGNLRHCTRQQNQMNQDKTHGSSRFKGVTWHKASGKWMAVIRHNRRNIYLGLHVSEESAARAYDARAIELFGEFCRLNFPAESVA